MTTSYDRQGIEAHSPLLINTQALRTGRRLSVIEQMPSPEAELLKYQSPHMPGTQVDLRVHHKHLATSLLC